MRVLYLNPCGQLGGAETSLRELLSSIREAAPEWQLWLVLGEDGPMAEEARKIGVQVVIAPFPAALASLGDARTARFAILGRLLQAAGATIRYKMHLARIVESIHPHIIHTNGFKMHLLGAWTRPRGTPLVWHIHDYVSARRLMSRFLYLSRKACSVAVVNSKSVAHDLRALLPSLPIAPIYNAIDLERFSPAGMKLDLDALSGLTPAPPGIIRVGLVATFARWKGHKVFLRALSRLSSDIPIRGYVIGGPIYQTNGSQWSLQELREEVSQLGLSGKVGFTGFLHDTAPAMRSLDIVVHASTQPEPFGMVIIEAMASGTAVIASQAGGATELFKDGENALAHPPGDEAALSRQITRLAGDQELRQRMGKAGRLTAEQQYQGKRLAQELLAVYREIGHGPSEASPNVAVQSTFRTAGE
jgi:glycosyltransferase involved in cell wall biosynthesis